MVVVIAPEKDIKGEINILDQLFKAGLECYHLRKPAKDYEEHAIYLNQIDSKYHNRVVVHFFHELVKEYNLKGIHFQERKRIETLENYPVQNFNNLQMLDKTISSSFHETEDLANCAIEFNYHLLSPVFSSISKLGYEGRGFDVNHIDKTVIGMGGVTSKNIEAFKTLGFKGVGVLGGIWNSSVPIESFEKMKKYFE